MSYTTVFEIALVASFSIAGAALIHAIVGQSLFGDEQQQERARVRQENWEDRRN